MLVIRRRVGESILIGEDIEVQVADIGTNRVKLSVRAPAHVPVVRNEVKLTRDQNVASARDLSPALVRRLAESLRRA